MPSASASATPFARSSDAFGTDAPTKSCCVFLRPLSEHWPIETFSASLIGRAGSAATARASTRSGVEALRGGANVRGVQRQPDEQDAADQVADHGRDLVPDHVVGDRE